LAHRATRDATGLAAAGLLLCLVAFPRSAPAQTPAQVQKKVEQSGHTEGEVREKIRASGLSPDQVRDALQERGLSPDALDQYMPGGTAGKPTQPATSQPPPTSEGSSTSADTPKAAAAQRLELLPENLPEFTKEIAKRVPTAVAVLPFGYEIFRYAPTTFEPLAAGPVDPDYPIGPGDEVIVQVWGDNELTHGATVTREATITVPDIGQVVLNGLTLAQAKRLITDRLATVYSGIRARRPTTFVDVTLGKLRTIQVFILGDVVRPGGYTISSVSTVLNALYNGGGPTPSGSMRDVRIIRHDEIYRRVDLYGYILTGSKAEDVRLQNGDVVFVPPIGKTVAVTGEVHRPAIYELRPEERFHDLVRLSGGIRSTALLDRVQVDRIIPFSERDSLTGQDRVALDLPLKDILANPANDPELVDRDIVQVFRIGDVRKNTVAILGEVVEHPGTYQLHRGMKVSDLVSMAGGFTSDAYLDRATLVRTHPDLSRSIHRFNLGKAIELDPEHDLALEELDEIQVVSLWDVRDRHTVSITGSVRKPGAYEYLDGMTLMDLIFQAGGLKESANKLQAEIARVDSTTIATVKAARIFREPISADYGIHSQDTSFVLQQWDQVSVREIPDWQLQRNVTLTGEVQYPGTYALRATDERLSSVIARAGGLKSTAYPHGATFTRKKDDVGRLAVNVEAVVRHGDRKQDLVLEAGDAIDIPREPNSVKVVGEVGFPASVLYQRGRSLSYYIEQAGGYTDRSDKRHVRVVQANGRVRSVGRLSFDPRPDAGALVLVPPKPVVEKSETLKDIGMIVGILSGAATTIFLAHQVTK
jgi:protein involved in polysaccharide export with SLBB domain